jgi:hypothetical protein
MNDLPISLKKHLREIVEAELFSQHKQFFKCTNHLHETKWLTDTEIEDQHEFYPYQPSLFDKLSRKDHKKRKIKVPKSDAVDKYVHKLREDLSSDIEKRIQKDREKRKEARARQKSKSDQEREKTLDDKTYQAHPDYKLYENHLGERRWLTPEEYENQDEFTLEVVPISRKIFSILKWTVPIILVIMIGGYILSPNLVTPTLRGYLQVESNEPLGQLYIDHKLKLGLSLDKPLRLSEGKYRISYRKAGYESSPPFHTIQINQADTISIFFSLISIKSEELAIINLSSTYPDAKVFVENNFHGLAEDNSKMILKPGKYQIALKKENFTAVPPFAEVTLSKGDSINLSFTFTDRSVSRQRNSDDDHGLIEVTSNLQGIKIFMDGKYTGYNTDHIFNKIPYGKHTISLQKEGYVIDPNEKSIRLTRLYSQQYVNFILKKASLEVSLKTSPVKGKIYLDGKEIATGSWKGGLAPGKYNLRFGAIDSYHAPQPAMIEIDEGKPASYTFTYTPTYSLTFSPLGLLPKNASGNIQIGYVDEDQVFNSDPNNGPEIIKREEIGEKVWILAYAFAYRNPPENDALVFTFSVPSSIDLSKNLWLKMWGYKTDENYPMEFNSISEIRISINNRMIQKDYTPRYSIEDAGESIFERFRINNLVRHGKNRLQISTGPVNTTYFALWKIAIE